MKLEWSQRAALDVKHLRDYIALDSTLYAYRFIERLLQSVERLTMFPASGRKVQEAHDDAIREVIYQGYRVIYRIEADLVQIVTVVHGSRDLTQYPITK